MLGNISRLKSAMLSVSSLLMFALILSQSQLTVCDLAPADLDYLTALVHASMDAGDIPGVALSIVNRSSVLVQTGFGVANVTSGQPMSSDTLLLLGSTTKAFTAALLAMLIEKHATDGVRFNWTTPVQQLLGPSFKLYDEQLTTQTTLEDILSHRTGIPDYFLLILAGYPYHVTRQQLIHSLRYHKPAMPFREEYIYNNHLYVLAGYVAEVLERKSWENLVKEMLLQPLNMTSTTFVSDVLLTSSDKMAASCGWTQHGCVPVDIQLLDQVNIAAPAGAIISTGRDMSRWMMWHLAGGAVPPYAAEDSLIDKDSLWETYRGRNTAFSWHFSSELTTTSNMSTQHVAYGLGWITSYYRGDRCVWHSGSISTYKAHVWLYPDAGIGIFAGLSGPHRYDTTEVFYDLMRAISDVVVFNMRPPSTEHSPVTATTPDRQVIDGLPPRPLSHYTGLYVGQWLQINATVSVDHNLNILRLSLGRMLTAELRNYDCAEDRFDAVIGGRMWWLAEGLPQRAVLSVRFRSSKADNRLDVLELPVAMTENPVLHFTRPGVKLADEWTPPSGHSYGCTAVRSIGPQAFMSLMVIVSYLLVYLSV